MDVITFYEVSEDVYEKELAVWRSGRYKYKMRETVFDMSEHNKLLHSTAGEVEAIQEKQARYQEEMLRLEQTLLDKWLGEKNANGVSADDVATLLGGKAHWTC